jgi:predicted membrane channel-forming protein YqfA (hemolysin III family)
MTSDNASDTRLNAIGVALLGAWLLALLAGPYLLAAAGVALNAHGHAHLHAHGHPFADARTFWGIPNAMDVLSNLPLALAGVLGLWAASLRRLPPDSTLVLRVFFTGLLLCGLCSAWYHAMPSAQGLVLDRMGMAVAFAGALSLAVAERVGPRTVAPVLGFTLLTALVSSALPFTHDNVLPWAVVQFGGVAVIVWAAFRRPAAGAMGVHLGALIALYALAKVLEMGDAAVFHASGEWISGHSLKHVAAALAAWPVFVALKRQPLRQNPAARR